jgi:hypothetical protein
MPERIPLPWGWIEYGPNEVGKISFNRLRPDGQQEELVLLQGKIDERFRPPSMGGTSGGDTQLVGELRLDLRRPPRPGDPNDDAQMIPICQMRYDGIVFHVPVGLAPSSGRVSRFYSDDGRFCFNVQGDEGGHIVQYDTHGTADETQWTAIGQFRASA